MLRGIATSSANARYGTSCPNFAVCPVRSFGGNFSPRSAARISRWRSSSASIRSIARAAAPCHTGVAREEVTVVINGKREVLEVVRQDRIHGREGYWLCPQCGALRWHLYLRDGELACRVCHRLDYRSRRP